MSKNLPQPVRIFYSYAHEDEALLRQLKAHLAEIRRQGLIEECFDREIRPGEAWAGAIDTALEQANLVLLLVSSDFLDSGYCNGVELKRALQRSAAGTARIIPVYLRPAVWQGAPFAGFQGMLKDARPVTDYPDRDAAWVEVVEGIVRAAREIRGEAKPVRGLLRRSPEGARPRRWTALSLGATAALAVVVAWRLLVPHPTDPELQRLLDQGGAFLETGRYEQALVFFNAALEVQPGNAAAEFGRAKARIFAHADDAFDVAAAANSCGRWRPATPRTPMCKS